MRRVGKKLRKHFRDPPKNEAFIKHVVALLLDSFSYKSIWRKHVLLFIIVVLTQWAWFAQFTLFSLANLQDPAELNKSVTPCIREIWILQQMKNCKSSKSFEELTIITTLKFVDPAIFVWTSTFFMEKYYFLGKGFKLLICWGWNEKYCPEHSPRNNGENKIKILILALSSFIFVF